MRRPSRTCGRPAPSSSARPTCTSTRSAPPAKTRRSGRCAIRSTPRARRAVERRIGGERRGRNGARQHRHRHRRLDQNSRLLLRHRRPQAVDRRGLDRRRRSAVVVARSRRTARAHGGRCVDGVPRADGRPRSRSRWRRPRLQHFDSPCRVRTSATCWTTTSAAGLKRRWTGFGWPAFAHSRGEIPHSRRSPPSICTSRSEKRSPITRDARGGAGALYRAGSPASGDGAAVDGRRLRAGARRTRATAARRRCGACRLRRAGAADAADSRAGDRRRAGPGGGDEGAAAQRHAPADAALQPHRTSGDLDPVRSHARGHAVRAAARGRTSADRQRLARRLPARASYGGPSRQTER